MSEFIKDADLTLLKAPVKRCLNAARYKVEKKISPKHPEIADLVQSFLKSLGETEATWKEIGAKLHDTYQG